MAERWDRPGMNLFVTSARRNTDFRRILSTKLGEQIVAMAIDDFIGEEAHDAAQDFVLLEGRVVVTIGQSRFVAEVPGTNWKVPAGEFHNVARFGLGPEDPPLAKLLTVYDRVLHNPRTDNAVTRQEAEAKESAAVQELLGADLTVPVGGDIVNSVRRARARLNRRRQRVDPASLDVQVVAARLVRVIDGDSVVVDVLGADGQQVFAADQHVRLQGVDTPEVSRGRSPKSKLTGGMPYGEEAKAFVEQLLTGPNVMGLQLRSVGREQKTYGRSVASLFVLVRGPDNRVQLVDVQAELLRAGLAWHYGKYDQTPALKALEQEARAARRGLWADPQPQAPWDWRRMKRQHVYSH